MKKAYCISILRAILFLIIIIFQLFSLSGQVPVSDSLAAVRLKEIQKLLHKDKSNAQYWWYGWLAGYSAATVGQGMVYFLTDNNATKQDMALGSATTLLGALGQLVTPLIPPGSSPGDLKNISDVEINNPGYYEELLKELSHREKDGRSWKMHAVTGLVNLGSGLITWRGFHRTFKDGAINFALNMVITEAQIWSQPTSAVKNYQNYCRQYVTGSRPESLKPEMEWVVRVYPGSISVALVF
jgi:hypothetical protein